MPGHRLFTLSVLSALLLAIAGCGDKPLDDPRTAAPLVRTATVQTAGADARSFTGTVSARVQSDLGFRVAGKVLERRVDAGQAVQRGQLLMRIDPVDLKLATLAQEQAVMAARARAQQTAQDEQRMRDLRGTGAISASAYDQAKASADAAAAQLGAAEAQARTAQNASRYAELSADTDGVVTDTLAEPGQVVGAGQIVVRIAQAGAREAVVQLPETLRPAVGSMGLARLFGADGKAQPTRLRQLANAADRSTRTFEARYVLEGELAKAALGTTVTIQLAEQPAAAGSLQVPIGALHDFGQGPGVWVLAGAQPLVSWRPVAVRQIDAESARVAGELQPGEHIVALGAHLLREGEQVRVAAGDATAAGAAK